MTRISRNRVLSVLAILAGSLVFYACGSYALARVAHADPVVATQSALDADWQAIQQYGLIPAIAVVLFGVMSWLLKRNESTHWIAQGRTLAIVTAVMSVIGSVIAWKFNGAPAGSIIAAAMASVSLILHPTTAAAATKMAAIFLVLSLGGVSQLACGPKVKAWERAVWECTDPIRKDAVDTITPAVISVIKAASSADGKVIDTSTVKAAISKANLLTEAGLLLSCAAASAFAILTQPPVPAAPGAPASSPFNVDPAAAAKAWAEIDVEMFGGAKFDVGSKVM